MYENSVVTSKEGFGTKCDPVIQRVRLQIQTVIPESVNSPDGKQRLVNAETSHPSGKAGERLVCHRFAVRLFSKEVVSPFHRGLGKVDKGIFFS